MSVPTANEIEIESVDQEVDVTGVSIEDDSIPLSLAQLKYSYDTMMNISFFNVILFPMGLLFWKTRYGFLTDYDLVFGVVGAFWQGSIWLFFLIFFLVSPVSLTLAWIPFILTSIVVWPMCYEAYNHQDETLKA